MSTVLAILSAASVDPAALRQLIQEEVQRAIAPLEATVAQLREENARLLASAAQERVSAAVSPLGSTGRRLSHDSSSASCCRWTPDSSCTSTSRECTQLYEYLEAKTTTHVFAAVEDSNCLGSDATSWSWGYNGHTGKITLGSGGSTVTSIATPLKVTHATSCGATLPTLTLQLDTTVAGSLTVGSTDVGAELADPMHHVSNSATGKTRWSVSDLASFHYISGSATMIPVHASSDTTQGRYVGLASGKTGDHQFYYAGEDSHDDLIMSSPPFDATSYSTLKCSTIGGTGGGWTTSGTPSWENNFMGVAVSTSGTAASASYYQTGQNRAYNDEHCCQAISIDLSSYTGTHYFHLIDTLTNQVGGWSWIAFNGCWLS